MEFGGVDLRGEKQESRNEVASCFLCIAETTQILMIDV